MKLITLLCASDIPISSAALYALVGFLIVLAVLAILVGIFYLTGFLFQKTRLGADKLFERKPKQQASEEKAPAVVSQKEDDGEVVAAITAAIVAMYADNTETDGCDRPDFVIKRKK